MVEDRLPRLSEMDEGSRAAELECYGRPEETDRVRWYLDVTAEVAGTPLLAEVREEHASTFEIEQDEDDMRDAVLYKLTNY